MPQLVATAHACPRCGHQDRRSALRRRASCSGRGFDSDHVTSTQAAQHSGQVEAQRRLAVARAKPNRGSHRATEPRRAGFEFLLCGSVKGFGRCMFRLRRRRVRFFRCNFCAWCGEILATEVQNPKSQINSKFEKEEIRNEKVADADLVLFGTFEFEISSLFGIWDFEFSTLRIQPGVPG